MPNGESMDTSENTGNDPGLSPPNGGVPLEVTADMPMAEEETPSQNEREITQTDHLNKSLLTSFLSRLNDPNFRIPQPHSQDEEAEAIASELHDQQQRVEANGDGHQSHAQDSQEEIDK